MADPARIERVFGEGKPRPTVDGQYLHWDELCHREPPDGLTHEDWWARTKIARRALYQQLPLEDEHGRPFVVAPAGVLQRQLHEADRDLSGRMDVPDQLTTDGVRDRYQISALVEEAITSSQLEGAATTRVVANEMLRSGRSPRTHDERMIFNNFRAMEFIRSIRDEPLSPELVLRVHRVITDGTLDDATACGRLRNEEESRGHWGVYAADDTLLHRPPPALQLPERLRACCDFANDVSPSDFIHPIVRSTLLHFWIGFDHPFVDGNGRTARALFYWSMLRQGYWLSEFLSVSHILRKAPVQYARAYLHSETDENDATYFVLYQMDVLRRATEALTAYVGRKAAEVRRAHDLLRQSALNHRQVALLGHALRDPDARYTAKRHAVSHRVTRQTARTDLKELAEAGLLLEDKLGHAFVFTVPNDLESRVRAFGERPPVDRRGPGRPPRPSNQGLFDDPS